MGRVSKTFEYDVLLYSYGCNYPAEPFRRIIRYPAEPFRRIIRYPAEPVQGVPPDYLLFGGTIAMSGFRRIICYPAERFL